jgi:hypothetical protein
MVRGNTHKEIAGNSKFKDTIFCLHFRHKKGISKMSEILEGPVERIIVETKEAPAPVGPYSQVGGNLKRKYPEIEEATFVTIGEVLFRVLSDGRRKYFC